MSTHEDDEVKVIAKSIITMCKAVEVIGIALGGVTILIATLFIAPIIWAWIWVHIGQMMMLAGAITLLVTDAIMKWDGK